MTKNWVHGFCLGNWALIPMSGYGQPLPQPQSSTAWIKTGEWIGKYWKLQFEEGRQYLLSLGTWDHE